jgi:hypothetical protein
MSFGVIESPPWGFESERTEAGDTSSFFPYTTVTGKVKQAFDLKKTGDISRKSEIYQILKLMC